MLSLGEMRRYAGKDPVTLKLEPELVFGDNPNLFSFRAAVEQVGKAYLAEGWEELGSGRHRTVYGSPDGAMVAKVSRTMAGVQANLFEWLTAKDGNEFMYFYQSGVKIPVPKVFWHQKLLHDVSILFVEWVYPSDDYGYQWEEWMNYVDCNDDGPQFGETADGRMVCFDWCPF